MRDKTTARSWPRHETATFFATKWTGPFCSRVGFESKLGLLRPRGTKRNRSPNDNR